MWNDGNGDRFAVVYDPALWSSTKQSFAAALNQNVKFLRCVKSDFIRGDSDPQVRQERDGGFILQVVGSTPNGSAGCYRTLADKDDYGGTLVSGGFLYRYVTVMGSFRFLATPSNVLPGGPDDGLLISNLLGADSEDTKPLLGAWYTGAGVNRPISGGSTRVFQKHGTYNDGDDSYNLAFYTGTAGGEDSGRLMLFEDAPHGIAFQFTFFAGPRCEQIE